MGDDDLDHRDALDISLCSDSDSSSDYAEYSVVDDEAPGQGLGQGLAPGQGLALGQGLASEPGLDQVLAQGPGLGPGYMWWWQSPQPLSEGDKVTLAGCLLTVTTKGTIGVYETLGRSGQVRWGQ